MNDEEMSMWKVFIVDDHPLVRQNYVLLIRREPDLECCGEAASGSEAMSKIPLAAPDIVVLDVSLQGDLDGVEFLKQFRRRYLELPVLVVSGHDEAVYAERILRLGAQGYVMKGDAVAFLRALREVAGGETYLSDQLRNKE
jgi:DNA-binding NarL/FixJ family response regulator